MIGLALAVTPPRFLRQYRERATFRRRVRHADVNGNAHIKGGTINGVRAIAGYVLDAGGRRWSVVCLINHPKVTNANAAIGRCATRVNPAGTRVLVDIVSTVMHGGPQVAA